MYVHLNKILDYNHLGKKKKVKQKVVRSNAIGIKFYPCY